MPVAILDTYCGWCWVDLLKKWLLRPRAEDQGALGARRSRESCVTTAPPWSPPFRGVSHHAHARRLGGGRKSHQAERCCLRAGFPCRLCEVAATGPHHHSDQVKRGSQRNSEDSTPCAAHGRRWHRPVSDGREDCSSERSRDTEPAKCVCVGGLRPISWQP